MRFLNKSILSLAIASAISQGVSAEVLIQKEQNLNSIEEIAVIGKSVSYSNNATNDAMLSQQSTMTSVLATVDNLPGVLINEGDSFGADDWSTTVSIRGFQLSLDEQQVGVTVDGIANGNSNYGGGAKANRYIDTENLKSVEVGQGTADISSRSNEALGGTLNFTTYDPTEEEKVVFSSSVGSFDASKYFVRYETGELLEDTYAWVSFSSASSSDFMQQSAENTRDHLAAKLISTIQDVNVTAYLSIDDVHEDNYQRVSATEFAQNPTWDRLTADWTGVPYVDQLYRKGWSTLRKNNFAYLQAEFNVGEVEFKTNVYYHDNTGRGDWVPPYVVNLVDDANGSNVELESGFQQLGGAFLGTLKYVDASGQTLSPADGCLSSITFPYGGADSSYDPACYDRGAIPVGSYRHTHYKKQRFGINSDFTWNMTGEGFDNSLRGGLWLEDYNREEYRDWHKIIDSRVGYEYDQNAYWVQYSREYPVKTAMFYLEDTLEFGSVTGRLGLKKFLVDLERKDKFDNSSLSVSSNSDPLLSAGLVARLPIEGVEVFAGYAENFAAIKDEVLERESSALNNVAPETAKNIDLGIRFDGKQVNAAITLYKVDFKNRLTFIAPGSASGNDYLIGTNGSYINTGGIVSDGIEASLSIDISETLSLYSSLTKNNSTYASGSVDYPQGNTVFGSVEDMGVLSLDWSKNAYSLGLSTKWVGDRWLDAANTQRLKAYTTSDLYAAVDVGSVGPMKNLTARLTVNNLGNASYIGGVAGGWGGWIGSPRVTALNLTASF